MNISIDNVVNVSVSQVGAGLGKYNTSNLAIFSHEAYESSFGSDGYKIYLAPKEVEEDFGSASITYKQALAIFSQQPNVLAGGGYLVVIPISSEVQDITFDATPISGDFVFTYNGANSATIQWNDTASNVQTAIRTIPGLESVTVAGAIDDTDGLTINFAGVQGDIALATITSNTLQDGVGAVTAIVTEGASGELLGEAISRTSSVVEYFGILATYFLDQSEALAAGAVVQTLSKILFLAQKDAATIEPGGTIDLLRQGSYTQTRGLYYGSDDALYFAAAYAGRGLSTNFTGSLTTQTMHLKSLATIVADATITQTIIKKAKDAGADVYASIQGVPKTFTSGANQFFDNVYNLLWFVGDLKIEAFNILATTGTKIPQTETGIGSVKSALRSVCEAAVANAYLAPGSWTSPNTFGNQDDFLENIAQRGYYIYSTPVGLQSPVDRADRKSPLIQIAAKQAGAIHSASIIVNINE